MKKHLPGLTIILTFVRGTVAESCLYNYYSTQSHSYVYAFKTCLKCCGLYGSQYCCFSEVASWSEGSIAGMAIGGVVVVGLAIAAVIYFTTGKFPCITMSQQRNRSINRTARGTRDSGVVAATTTSGTHTMNTFPAPPPYSVVLPGGTEPAYAPPTQPYPGQPQPNVPTQPYETQFNPNGNPPPVYSYAAPPKGTVVTVQHS